MTSELEISVRSISRLQSIIEDAVSRIPKFFNSIDINGCTDKAYDEVDEIHKNEVIRFSAAISEVSIDSKTKSVLVEDFDNRINDISNNFLSRITGQLIPIEYDEYESIKEAFNGDIYLSYQMAIGGHGLTTKEKVSLLSSAAQAGHPEACNELSIWYSVGRNVPQSKENCDFFSKESFDLFEKQHELYRDLHRIISDQKDSDSDGVCLTMIRYRENYDIEDKYLYVYNKVLAKAYMAIVKNTEYRNRGYLLLLSDLNDMIKESHGVAISKQQQDGLIAMYELAKELLIMEDRGLIKTERFSKLKEELEELKLTINYGE